MWRHYIFRNLRNALLFGLGALGFIHELFTPIAGATERPTLLIVSATMMGLPLFLRAEEKIRRSEKNEDEDA